MKISPKKFGGLVFISYISIVNERYEKNKEFVTLHRGRYSIWTDIISSTDDYSRFFQLIITFDEESSRSIGINTSCNDFLLYRSVSGREKFVKK